jgi:alkylation response protein AidB-like acyl-CoA dehydrogenase
MAVTDPNADPHRRASQIIVPCDTPAFGRLNGGAQIYDGPDEVHKSIVARRILRRFGTI